MDIHIADSLPLFIVSVLSGSLASILGLGGGSLLMPALTLHLGVDFQHAAAAAISSVISSSIGTMIGTYRTEKINTRLVVVLSIMGGSGAVLGAMLSPVIQTRYLFLAFSIAVVLCLIALSIPRKEMTEYSADRIAKWLNLNSTYFDAITQTTKEYYVRNVPVASLLLVAIGTMSGLLGLGGGALMVTTMYRVMHLPLRVSTTSSSIIMGVMGILSAESFRENGYLVPSLVLPVMVGALVGASFGSQISKKTSPLLVKVGLQVSLAFVAIRMGGRFFG